MIRSNGEPVADWALSNPLEYPNADGSPYWEVDVIRQDKVCATFRGDTQEQAIIAAQDHLLQEHVKWQLKQARGQILCAIRWLRESTEWPEQMSHADRVAATAERIAFLERNHASLKDLP